MKKPPRRTALSARGIRVRYGMMMVASASRIVEIIGMHCVGWRRIRQRGRRVAVNNLVQKQWKIEKLLGISRFVRG